MSNTINKVEAVDVDLTAAPEAAADGGLPKAPRIPYGVYKLRIMDEPTFGKSKSSDKPMLTFECELVEPASVKIEGVEYKAAGQKFNLYGVLVKGETQTIRNLHDQLKLPRQFKCDPETGLPIGLSYKSAEFYATAVSETTDQEVDDGNGNKIPLTNPLTGKVLTSERSNIKQVLPVE